MTKKLDYDINDDLIVRLYILFFLVFVSSIFILSSRTFSNLFQTKCIQVTFLFANKNVKNVLFPFILYFIFHDIVFVQIVETKFTLIIVPSVFFFGYSLESKFPFFIDKSFNIFFLCAMMENILLFQQQQQTSSVLHTEKK